MKKLDRFIRKVSPLVDKELNENLPLYSSTFLSMKRFRNRLRKEIFQEIVKNPVYTVKFG